MPKINPAHAPGRVPRPEPYTVKGLAVTVPSLFQRTLENAYAGKGPVRSAIHAKCLECVGFEDASNRIRNCTCYRCPLWAWRRHQQDEASDAMSQAVEAEDPQEAVHE